MSELYSYKGAYPYPLPKNMDNYDIDDFVLAPEKPEISSGQFLEWDGEAWYVREANTSEIALKWQEVRDARDDLLSRSDITFMKQIEENGSISQSLKDYRNALRDLPQTQTDPFNITFPQYSE